MMRHAHSKRVALVALCLGALSALSGAEGRPRSFVERAVESIQERRTFEVPAAGMIEVAFSPNEGSEALVIKVIDSARSELRILSYSFTSARITEALIRARKRGVDVRLVADEKNNTEDDRSGKARAALGALRNAGADVRVISAYPIHHDKVIVADRETVELGSFNYSEAAARRNSENVMVTWRNAKLAEVYLQHFERNYRQSAPYAGRY